MAKKSTIFFCQNCGYESAKWLGQCPACKEWNTLVEETVVTGKAGKSSKKTESLAARIHEAQPVKLSGIKTESEIRTATGFEELDRVLGGGIVAGSLVLVGGDPPNHAATLHPESLRYPGNTRCQSQDTDKLCPGSIRLNNKDEELLSDSPVFQAVLQGTAWLRLKTADTEHFRSAEMPSYFRSEIHTRNSVYCHRKSKHRRFL